MIVEPAMPADVESLAALSGQLGYPSSPALVVAEGARGKGVGPRLIEEACAWARARGIAQVSVHSNVVREDAHRFYAREGFTLEKRQGVFTRKVS